MCDKSALIASIAMARSMYFCFRPEGTSLPMNTAPTLPLIVGAASLPIDLEVSSQSSHSRSLENRKEEFKLVESGLRDRYSSKDKQTQDLLKPAISPNTVRRKEGELEGKR